MRRTFLATIIALAAGAGILQAAAEDEVKQAEKNWAAAVIKNDFAALDRILAPQLIYTHSTAIVESKSDYLGKLKAGGNKYDSIEHENIRVAPYGDAAILHARLRMRGTTNGKPFDTRAFVTHVWVKQGGAWQLAAHQSTKIP